MSIIRKILNCTIKRCLFYSDVNYILYETSFYIKITHFKTLQCIEFSILQIWHFTVNPNFGKSLFCSRCWINYKPNVQVKKSDLSVSRRERYHNNLTKNKTKKSSSWLAKYIPRDFQGVEANRQFEVVWKA